jgi:hypothetical protein
MLELLDVSSFFCMIIQGLALLSVHRSYGVDSISFYSSRMKKLSALIP